MATVPSVISTSRNRNSVAANSPPMEAVILTVRDLHNQANPTTRPQAWWADSIVGEEGTDAEGAMVGFTVRVRMGADADQLAGGALEVAEVHWMVVGRHAVE